MEASRSLGDRPLGRTVSRLIPITLAVQVCGFAASVTIASLLGATYATDAYFLALSVPIAVYGVLVGTLKVGVIPALTELDVNEPEDFDKASSQLLSVVFALAVTIALVSTVIAILALPHFASGSDPRFAPLARELLAELAPLAVTGALVGVLSAVLSVRGRFAATIGVLAFDPLLRIVLVLSLRHVLGVHALALGNVAGSILAVAVLWILTRRAGARLTLGRADRSSFVRKVVAFNGPLIIAQTVLVANPVVDRAMATPLGAGSVTILHLALQVATVPVALLASTLVSSAVAIWGRRFGEHGWGALRSSVGEAIRAAILILPPIVVLGVCLRQPIMVALYQGGAYSASAVNHTASTFGMFLLGVPAQILIQVYASVFLVRKNSRIPMYIALANVVLNVVLNLVLREPLGVAGLALSTTITQTVLLGAYAYLADRRFGRLDFRALLPSALRVCVSAGVMAAIALAVMGALPTAGDRAHAILVIAVAGLAGVIVHIVVLGVTREPWVMDRLTALRRGRPGAARP